MDSTSLYRLRAGKSRLDGKLLVADTRKGVIDVLRVGLDTNLTLTLEK